MVSREEINLRQYIVSQRIVIAEQNDRIQNLVNDVEDLMDYIKDLEHTIRLREAFMTMELAPPG